MSKTDENKADSSTLTPEELGSVFDITGWLEREGKSEGWKEYRNGHIKHLDNESSIVMLPFGGCVYVYVFGPNSMTGTYEEAQIFPQFPDFPSALSAAQKFIALHKEVIL